MAVIATAFLLFVAVGRTARAQPAPDVLPIGTPIVFVLDGTLGPGAREGTVVQVHLRDALLFNGTLVAAAGTRAELLLGTAGNPERKEPRIVALRGFKTVAGLMPLRLDEQPVGTLTPGTLIAATTRAEIARVATRLSIRTPFPFSLSNDVPASIYTPTPARTAPPFSPGRGRPSPRPSPPASPSPVASEAPTSAPSASPR
jgi:hypothetical protein